MKTVATKSTLLLLSLTTLLSGCFKSDIYEQEFASLKVSQIKIVENGSPANYINYEYDSEGRISAIKETLLSLEESISYETTGAIVSLSNQNEVRYISLNNSSFGLTEEYYVDDVLTSYSEYQYHNGRMTVAARNEYDSEYNVTAVENYLLSYNDDDNLEYVTFGFEDEDDSYSGLMYFSEFSDIDNNFNVDILAIMNCHINNSFASDLGVLGLRSSKLPLAMTINYFEDDYTDVEYEFFYTVEDGYVTEIIVSTDVNGDNVYTISYE
ncbi:MAG: hypothetical protein R3Y04_03405 [Rikenellaceae bacterium]